MNRRETIKNLGAGSLMITIGGFSFYRCRDDAYVPHFFEQKTYDFLSAYAECVLPKCEESPGANEAGVASFLDQYLPACKSQDQLQGIKEVVQSLTTMYKEKGENNFTIENSDKKNTFMELIEKSELDAYEELKSLVLFAYYTSQEGMTEALRYDPVPGGYKGNIPLDENENAWAI